MKPIALVLSLLLVAVSCKKGEDNRAFSTWYINGEKFSSQNVQYSTSVMVRALGCLDLDTQRNSMFHFFFVNGITRMSSGPGLGFSPCSFSYHNKLYVAPYDTFFTVRWTGTTKFQVTIDSAWVYQLKDTTHQKLDSVFVKGVFSEP